MKSGFSERTFEFCFNAEYCQVHNALLASHPYIPSQRIEKDLGYDVEFELLQGNHTRSVFLQHKVPYFAEKKAGRNAQFFDVHNGPYFRFSVDNEQHNTLCGLSRNRGNAFYCSPRFNLRNELEVHFRARTIASTSILLNPVDVGDITDQDRHNITYNPQGSNPTLHSEARPFKRYYFGGKEKSPDLRTSIIDESYLEGLSKELVSQTLDSKFHKIITNTIMGTNPLQIAQFLLGRVYKVTWLILP